MEELNKIEKEFIALLRIISDKDVPKDVKRMILPRVAMIAEKVTGDALLDSAIDRLVVEFAEELKEIGEVLQ